VTINPTLTATSPAFPGVQRAPARGEQANFRNFD
jgi:hypothetical protein